MFNNHTLQVTDRDDSLLINKRFSVILSKAHFICWSTCEVCGCRSSMATAEGQQ